MLNFLSSGNQKQIVGIALTPGIGLEAVVFDKYKNIVIRYGKREVGYNFSTREIQDYVQFKTALVQLIDELKVSPKSPVYLVLPNVYFDFIEVPPTVGDSEIRTAILSKAEEFYLFKKDEPVSGWCEIANPDGTSQKKLAYTSFQKPAITEIREILAEVGLNLIGIESAYSASLRGLYQTGLLDDILMEDSIWTMMVVNTNSYTLFQMDGKNLLEYAEVPLAIKSFSPEEAYSVIVSSSSQLLDKYPSMRLYIVSQTDDICAEVLKRQMQFDREIFAIDSNKYSKKSIVNVLETLDYDEANLITTTVLGAASYDNDFGLTLNVLAGDPTVNLGVYFTANILGTPVEITAEFIQKLTILIVVSCVLLFGTLSGLFYFLDTKMQTKASELSEEIGKLDAQIAEESRNEQKQEIDMTIIIDELAAANVSAINFYDSIATDIPKNVWLTRYYNKNGDKIVLKGVAENIADIYEYYKNLRIVSPNSDIKLTELKVITQEDTANKRFLSNLSIDEDVDRLYNFEISNTQIALPSDGSLPASPAGGGIEAVPQGPLEETSAQMKPAQ